MIFIVFVYIQVWCIPLHYHLQFFDQLIETGTRARFLFPAVSHQLISVMDKKKKQLKLVRVPIHYYMYRHRFSDLVEEVSFDSDQLGATHGGSLGLSVSCLACEQALHLGDLFKYTQVRHARGNTTARGPPLARTRAVRFPRPNGELARRLILALSISVK